MLQFGVFSPQIKETKSFHSLNKNRYRLRFDAHNRYKILKIKIDLHRTTSALLRGISLQNTGFMHDSTKFFVCFLHRFFVQNTGLIVCTKKSPYSSLSNLPKLLMTSIWFFYNIILLIFIISMK